LPLKPVEASSNIISSSTEFFLIAIELKGTLDDISLKNVCIFSDVDVF